MGRVRGSLFRSYKDAYDFAMKGRSPYKHGVPFRSFGRVHVDFHSGVIAFSINGDCICKITTDDVMTFVATPQTVRKNNYTLAGSFHAAFPTRFINFDTGRYRVWPTNKTPVKPYKGWDSAAPDKVYYATDWQAMRSEGQEYFQHLQVNLVTGEILNPKDTDLIVDEDKRKEWLRRLKKFRVLLKTAAKVGAFDNISARGGSHYLQGAQLETLAKAIMESDLSPEVMTMLACMSTSWRFHNKPRSQTIPTIFDNAVKSSSRELRIHAGVLKQRD